MAVREDLVEDLEVARILPVVGVHQLTAPSKEAIQEAVRVHKSLWTGYYVRILSKCKTRIWI